MIKLLPAVMLALALVAPQAFADEIPAPSFTLADAAGNDVTLPGKQAGVEMYLFWASWCPYCKALMPHLQSIQIEYGDDVRIYALNIRDDEDPVAFMQEHGYDFVLLPNADPVMALYGVRSTPGVFLVDQGGNIRFNLYEMLFDDSAEFQALGNRQKSNQRAPYWAAEIRRVIDQILKDDVGGTSSAGRDS